MGGMKKTMCPSLLIGAVLLGMMLAALESLVQHIIRELEPDIVGRNIVWHIGELPVVSGDPAMLWKQCMISAPQK